MNEKQIIYKVTDVTDNQSLDNEETGEKGYKLLSESQFFDQGKL